MSHEIVVCVDTSAASRRAVEFACALARSGTGGSSVLLCHVIPWSPFSFTTAEENEHRHRRRDAEVEAASEQVMRPLVELATAGGVRADQLVRHGDPMDALIDVAETEKARLLVVGRTGDSGLRGRVFGTLAGQLVQNSPVPVTVVP